MDEVYEECFSYDLRTTDEDELNDTVSNPATPLTPHTPCTPVSDHDTDRSGFSVSLDSGIGSPSPFSMQNDACHQIIDVRSLKTNSKKDGAKTTPKAVDHTNKEKHRRERIKDSCDQLRVLLPYIRGRKTDMASILEMAVDYLRIVNMCMPQYLHDQIVEILTKDESIVPNKESKIRGKKTSSRTAGKSSVPPSGPLAELVEKTTGSQKKASKDLSLSEIANSCDIYANKRARLQGDNCNENGPESFHLDARLEPTLAGHTDVVPYSAQPAGLYSKSYTHEEKQTYSRVYSGSNYTDGFSAAQQIFNTYTANKSSLIEPNPYRPGYSTDSTLYHYYPNLVSNTPPQIPHYSSSSELLNSNNILSSVSYSSRLENVSMLSEAASKND